MELIASAKGLVLVDVAFGGKVKQLEYKLYKGIQGSYPVAVKVILKVGRECSIASRFGHGHLASSLISNAEPASLDPTASSTLTLPFTTVYLYNKYILLLLNICGTVVCVARLHGKHLRVTIANGKYKFMTVQTFKRCLTTGVSKVFNYVVSVLQRIRRGNPPRHDKSLSILLLKQTRKPINNRTCIFWHKIRSNRCSG